MDIIKLLDEKGIKHIKSNNPHEIKLQCISPDHEDGHPSMSYNLAKNIFNCWSCGYSGNHKKFLQTLGIETKVPISTNQTYKRELLLNKIRKNRNKNQLIIPTDAVPVEGSVKTVNAETMNNFNAFWTKSYGLERYICVPIYQYGKLKFFECRDSLPNSKRPKYTRFPAMSSSSEVLFPIDKLEFKSHIILVEGLYDLLNLWQYGYTSTLCNFGVANLSKTKIQLLKNINCTEVTIMFDGDKAGMSGALKVKETLEKNFIRSNIAKVPYGKDPGDLTIYEIQHTLNEEIT